ncbi:hypothetical protein [Dietzia lutea]|uniref:hypothetical protein n=1 Tax=Dietzia lutea TaxID=546160 RepID=UPI001F1C9F6B|nr:hypothetical protein [Dietzia lutea]
MVGLLRSAHVRKLRPAPAADAGPTAPATPAGAGATESATPAGAGEPIVDRDWELWRRAERQGTWQRPALGVFCALAFVMIANPDLLPGGSATSLAAFVGVAAVAVVGIVLWARRASFRGHSGSAEVPAAPGHRWWRSPALAGPAMFTLIFLGNLIGMFDHWPVILATAVVVVGCLAALSLPRYETADHIHGTRLENPPALTADAAAAVTDGRLSPDVLELLVLQHHTAERRISWCAGVLGADVDDIRTRISRGRRWLELPATEVHDPATANWVRLTSAGREALGYI